MIEFLSEQMSDEQRAAAEFLVEFFGPQRNRGMGRTYVMACVIIQTAFENPGEEIFLLDHTYLWAGEGTSMRHQVLKQMQTQIASILSGMPEDFHQCFTYRHAHKTLMYVPSGESRRVVEPSSLIPGYEEE